MIYLYTLAGPDNDVRYVGLTKNPVGRERSHRCLRASRNDWMARWLRKIGPENMRFVLLEVVDGDGGSQERDWIARYKAAGARLTNLTDGGEVGYLMAPSSRAKLVAVGKLHGPRHAARLRAMNEARRGKPLSLEHVEKVAAKLRGKKRPEYAKELDRINAAKRWDDPRMRELMLVGCRRGGADPSWIRASAEKRRGVPLTPKHKAKVSAGNKGKKHPGVAAYWERYRRGEVPRRVKHGKYATDFTKQARSRRELSRLADAGGGRQTIRESR